MHAFTASFNATLGQMTEMSQRNENNDDVVFSCKECAAEERLR